MHEITSNIDCELIPEDKRLSSVESCFDIWFPLVESAMYQVAEHISPVDYSGGLWSFYSLSSPNWESPGFLMAPDTDLKHFNVTCDNYWTGKLDPMEFGIVVGMYAYSRLSFACNVVFGRKC